MVKQAVNSYHSIEAVTFDAGATLIHLTESVGQSYSRIAREFDIHVDPEALEKAFRKWWSITPAPFSREKPDLPMPELLVDLHREQESERQWWRDMVCRVFVTATDRKDFATESVFLDFFDQLYDYFGEPGSWHLDSQAEPLLDHLANQNLQLAIISNFDERLRPILIDLGVIDRFDPIVISNEVRCSKPDPAIFESAIQLLDCAPNHILHVGDDPICDCKGAQAVGMRSYLVGKRYSTLDELRQRLISLS